MLALPARSDLTSQPCRDRPASNSSSIEYSWRARLFIAIVAEPGLYGFSLS